MERQARRAWLTVVGFALWTLVVWATRIDNVASDEELDTAGKVARMALAGSFIGLAVVSLARAGRGRRQGLSPRTIYVIGPFAVWTVLVWVVRSAGIVVDDYGAAFKVVHTVLAAVSIGLAIAAVRALRRSTGGVSTSPRLVRPSTTAVVKRTG